MIDIYIDDVRVKTIGLSDGKHNLILEAKRDKENKVQILFDDEELKSLCILSKNRCEIQGLIPVYNTTSGTAYVEQVRHGVWIKREKEGGIFANYECSVCSAYPTGGIRSYYCPNCGAKMREMTEE